MKQKLTLILCIVFSIALCACTKSTPITTDHPTEATQLVQTEMSSIPITETTAEEEITSWTTNPEQRYDETSGENYLTMMEAVLSGRDRVVSLDLTVESMGGVLSISEYVDAFSEQAGVPAAITKIATVDMDGDGMKEVLLWLTVNEAVDYGTVVPHYQDGMVFAQNFAYRQLFDVKSDGTFWKSGSSSEDGPARLVFGKDEWHYESVPAEGFHDKEGIPWTDYPCENLSDLLDGTY